MGSYALGFTIHSYWQVYSYQCRNLHISDNFYLINTLLKFRNINFFIKVKNFHKNCPMSHRRDPVKQWY